jgi:hypothetical protein
LGIVDGFGTIRPYATTARTTRAARLPAPEVIHMLVPAIALSWWLVSVPLHSQPNPRPGKDAAPSTRETAQLALDDETASSEHTSDRVLYRGTITAEIAREARTFLDLPMGAERVADVEGHRFVFVLERHYHPPGFVGAPTGWHKGVTVYELR